MLPIKPEGSQYTALSVGISDDGSPLVTVLEGRKATCYRLPQELSEWALTLVSFANMGEHLLPSSVLFTKKNGMCFADIL